MDSPFFRVIAIIGVVACVAGYRVSQNFGNHAEGSPPAAQMATSRPVQETAPRAGVGEVVLYADRGGHFMAEVDINGWRVPMLVDTGATVIALSQDDARAIGVDPGPAAYVIPLSTANGTVRAAPAMLREARIGGISVRDVQAVVLPRGALRQSLLGMSFLKKLRGFETSGGRLVLKG